MIIASRPLRFLAIALGGWIVIRIVLLWPADPIRGLRDLITVPASATVIAASLPTSPRKTVAHPPIVSVRPKSTPNAPWVAKIIVASADRDPAPTVMLLGLSALPEQRPPVSTLQPMFVAPPRSSPPGANRLAASAWVILRAGDGDAAFAPQLGGSQAGLRLTYALGDARRVSLAARVSGALEARQREAAIGIDWQPGTLPVHVVAEQRIGIEGTRGGPTLGLIGGFGPVPIAAGFRVEAYGQAGMIARDGVEGYADGATRIAHRVARIGPVAIELGAGAWGGAQRGASRLDIGPSASAALPISNRQIRLTIDWRQRIAGNATPRAGPALSIGSDF